MTLLKFAIKVPVPQQVSAGGGEGVLDVLGDAAPGRHGVPVLPGPVPDRLDLFPTGWGRLDNPPRLAGPLRCDPGAVLDVLVQLAPATGRRWLC